jgi:probable rRNA maturation factor
VDVEGEAAVDLARRVLTGEGIENAELGIAFVAPEESRALKRDHLGIDEATDVLSFPIDGREPLSGDVPRQLGDVVLCPAVVGDAWRRPLAHGLLHLLGYEHGPEMEAREEGYTG